MTNSLDKMFEDAQEITDLKKRSRLFEETLFKSITALDSINKAYEMGKLVHDNESLKKSLPEGSPSLLAVDYATQSLSWDNIKDVAVMYDELRKMYKDIYKKNAITAAPATAVNEKEAGINAWKISATTPTP
jgi:hypothetical protein